MDVILFENVPNLGPQGTIVSVAPGYFRNFLSPNGMAVEATKDNRKRLGDKMKRLEKQAEEERKAARGVAEKIGELTVTYEMKASEEDKLFGSVSEKMIAETLNEKGFELDRHHVVMLEPIKKLGEYVVEVRLHNDVTAELKVVVEREEGAL